MNGLARAISKLILLLRNLAMPRIYYKYKETLDAQPVNNAETSKLIVFSQRFRGYYRFDGENFRDCVNAYQALKVNEFDQRGTFPDFQEVIDETTWHKIMLDLDYDIDDDHERARDKYCENVQWFRNAVNEIIMASIDTYFAMFESVITRNDCHIYESMNENEPQRLSAHIIIQRAIPNFRIAAHFADLVISALPEDARNIVDRGVYASLHNLRIAGSAKLNSVRVKKIPRGSSLFDSFVSAPCIRISSQMADIWMQRLSVNKSRAPRTDIELPDRLIEKAREIIQSKYGASHRFHRCIGPLVTFSRNSPSFCSICEREHEHDNSVVVYITRTLGTTQFFEMCRRDPMGRKILLDSVTVSQEIDHIISDTAGTPSLRSDRAFEPAHAGIRELCYAEPAMQNYPNAPDTLFIRAPMKLGKTKALRTFVTDYVSHDQAKIIFVSFRRTFSASICKQFPEFVIYSDIKGSLDSNKMIIQVESLHRIAPDKIGSVDLLILDESESIIDQFDSGLSADHNGDFAVFQWLIRTAKRCIALDAYMSERTYTVISRIRTRGHTRETDMLLIKNTYKNAADDKYYITSSRDQWLLALLECIHRGEKIVICANSANEGKILYELLQNHTRDFKHNRAVSNNLRIKFYCAETSTKIKSRDFGNVATSWADCDILIYTPTLTAGVSFELHQFDRMFGYFTDKSCSAQTCIQMMGRIRNLRCRQVFICLNVEPGALPETRESLILWLRFKKKAILSEDLLIEYNDNGLPSIPNSDYAELRIQNAIARNRSRNNFAREMVNMITEVGAQCIQLSASVHQKLFGTSSTCEDLRKVHDEHADVGAAVTSKFAAKVSEAREITGDEYKRICAQRDNLLDPAAHNENDQIAARKFELRATYRKHDCLLTPEFVATFMRPEIMHAFKNLSVLCDYFAQSGRNMLQALKTMRQVEAAHMKSIARASGQSISDPEKIMEIEQVNESEMREFDFDYVYETHRLIHIGVMYLGFTSVLDTNMYSAREMKLKFGQILTKARLLIPQLSYQFKTAPVAQLQGGGLSLEVYIDILNHIMRQTYGITIISVGDLYHLAMISLFHIRPDGHLVLA